MEREVLSINKSEEVNILLNDIRSLNTEINNLNTKNKFISQKIKEKVIKPMSKNSKNKLNALNFNIGINIQTIEEETKVKPYKSKHVSKKNVNMLKSITTTNHRLLSNEETLRGNIINNKEEGIQTTKSKIAIQRFKNVYDSFDSNEDEKDYNYYDFIPRMFSLTEKSSFYLFWKNLRMFVFYWLLILYPILLIQVDNILLNNLFF